MHAPRITKPDAVPSSPAAGLTARTRGGLHQAVSAVLYRHLPSPARIADLGAGTGAWAAQLASLGHAVVGVERDTEAWGLPGVPLVEADLDAPFAHLLDPPFAAVTAIEVIEHLENPRAFLRECHGLLRSGGLALITTPNFESVPARLQFLASGTLRHFGRDPRYSDPTHITPIHSMMFERMARDTNFHIVEHTFNRPRPSIARPLYRVLDAVLTPVLRGPKGGDCHIFVLRRGAGT